eukprot:g1019.t1
MVASNEAVDFDPSKNSTFLLFRHITLKGTQLGSLVGCGLVLPLLTARGYFRGAPLNSQSALKALTYSSIGGVIAADAFGVYKYIGMDQEGIEDRVYRLHYNEGQNRCDLFSLISGGLGAAAVPFILNRSPFSIIGAFTVGSAIGTIAHILTAKEGGTGVEKMVHEVKTS